MLAVLAMLAGLPSLAGLAHGPGGDCPLSSQPQAITRQLSGAAAAAPAALPPAYSPGELICNGIDFGRHDFHPVLVFPEAPKVGTSCSAARSTATSST